MFKKIIKFMAGIWNEFRDFVIYLSFLLVTVYEVLPRLENTFIGYSLAIFLLFTCLAFVSYIINKQS